MKKLMLLLFVNVIVIAKFLSIDDATLIKMQKKGIIVIDIRTQKEQKETGIIKNAIPITFFDEKGKAHAADFMFKLGHYIKDKNTPFIIYCAHANRSKAIGKWLNSLGFKKVYELKGGIVYGWLQKGHKAIKN